MFEAGATTNLFPQERTVVGTVDPSKREFLAEFLGVPGR